MASPILINGKEIKCPSTFNYIRSDYDSESYRGIDGTLQRARICTKVKLELTWRAGSMDVESMATLLQAVDDVFFEVTYWDLHDGAMRTATFYVGDRSGSMYAYHEGKIIFDEISFNLIER